MPFDSLQSLDVPALDLTGLDVLALVWFALCTIGYNLVTSTRPLWKRGLLGAIQLQRRRWMLHMARRTDRSVDVMLISSLASGNTFFASTSVILLGVLSAFLGAGERAQAVLQQIPIAVHASPVAWNVKVLVLMTVLIYAFFKFAWAFRLAHYAMIMMGAMPSAGEASQEMWEHHAERAAQVAGIAAEHGNLGLRSYYFAMAGLAWFLHPALFLVTTTLVVLIVIRREYFSRTLASISERKTLTISSMHRF